MNSKIHRWPKIELHCHLDGSIRPALFQEMAEQEGIAVPDTEEALREYLEAPKDCSSLKEYLERFDRVLFCMQREDYLRKAACDCLKQAKEDGVIYQEIRFAPAFSLGKGLTMEAAVLAVIRGIREGEERYGVKSSVILCMMRGRPEEENVRVIDSFLKIREKKDPDSRYLGGLDLAGDEASYPLAWYEKLFRRARKEEIPFTVHAGECGSYDNIRLAVRLGAKRIGHGIAAVRDAETMRLLNEFQIVAEMCPTSNYQTRAVHQEDEYPLRTFWKRKVRASLHTDNRTVSGTTLTGEYEWVLEHFPELSKEDFLQMNRYALKEAFLPEDEKAGLLKRLEEGFAQTD